MRYYIDTNQIKRLASDADAMREGHVLFRKGCLGTFYADESQADAPMLKTTVQVGEGVERVQLIFDELGILRRYSCTCSSSRMWKGACQHGVAAMFGVYELNRQNMQLSAAHRVSERLLDEFEQMAYGAADGEVISGQQVELLPEIIVEAYSTYLSFRIGRRRKYILKDIKKFVDDINHGNTVAYGKELEFAHKRSMFDAKSVKLIDFISNQYEAVLQYHNILQGSFSLMSLNEWKRRMPLSHHGLDLLVQMYLNEDIEFSFKGRECGLLHFSDEEPPIKTVLVESEDGLELKLQNGNRDINGPLAILPGENAHYLMLGDTASLYTLSDELFQAISPIISGIAQSGRLIFPPKARARFGSYVLPALRHLGLSDEALPEDLEIPPLKTKLYFDNEKGDVICNVEFSYNGKPFNPYEGQPQEGEARDALGEHRFKVRLEQLGFVRDKEGNLRLHDNDMIHDFFNLPQGLAELRKRSEVFTTESFLYLASRPQRSPQVGLRISGNLLEAEISGGDYDKAELVKIIESFREKKRYHRLNDGRFVELLGNQGIEQLAEMTEALGISEVQLRKGKAKMPQSMALYAGRLAEEMPEVISSRNEAFDKLLADFNGFKDIDFPLPQSLAEILRPYQQEGFRWLKLLARYGFGGVLADDMGLGKTLQVITLLLDEQGAGQNIVVAPTSLVYNWEREIKRFAPELRVNVIAGMAAKRGEDIAASVGSEIDVLITTYDMLKRDIEHYEAVDFNFVIADEAQFIKNPATQNATAVKTLRGRARFALTGTPIENTLSELWSIFDFIMPGYLYNHSKFTKLFETPIFKQEDKNAALRLKKQISPFILRRIKEDVLTELPEKIETTLYAEMGEEQHKLYAAFLMKARGELEELIGESGYERNQIAILSRLTRLRQLCCHPALFVENYSGGSGKLDMTMDCIRSAAGAGHRLLVFSQFTGMLEILRRTLDAEGFQYFYLDGATPSSERVDMAERFNNGEREMFLISLKAGGTGLNLIGADIVIHYDPWWNPAVMEQAADRAHRFGQEKVVQVINIVAKDTIEEKIIQLQEKKRNLVDSVIDEGGNTLSKMTKDEILGLFK